MPQGPERELLTERLRLRRPPAGDVPAVQRIHQDPAAVAHNPSDALAGPEAAEDLLRRWQDRWRSDGVGYWIVTGRADPAVLGFCGVKPMRLADAPVLNLFYRFDPVTWGRGLATEAAIAVTEWVTRVRPEQRLIARIRPDNTASARVAAKAGLVRAPELDTDGEDGPDHIWVQPSDPRHSTHRSRPGSGRLGRSNDGSDGDGDQDNTKARRTGPEGHLGATTKSCAAGSNPNTGASDKSLSEPASPDATPTPDVNPDRTSTRPPSL